MEGLGLQEAMPTSRGKRTWQENRGLRRKIAEALKSPLLYQLSYPVRWRETSLVA